MRRPVPAMCVLPTWRCARRLSSRCSSWKWPAWSGNQPWRRASSRTSAIGFARRCRCTWRDARTNRSRSAGAPEPGAARREAARLGNARSRSRHSPRARCAFQAVAHRIPSQLLLVNPLHLHWRPLHRTKKPGITGLFCFSKQLLSPSASSTMPQSAARAVRARSPASGWC